MRVSSVLPTDIFQGPFCRTMIIWGVGLFAHYQIDPSSPFGEQWTDSSQLQLFGFVILITGQATWRIRTEIPWDVRTSQWIITTVDICHLPSDNPQGWEAKKTSWWFHQLCTGWWFGTFYIFHILGNHQPV